MAAARQGRRTEARRLLQAVLERDDSNELAWMWMASVVDTPRERRVCLETVLELNPGSQRARQELDRLNRTEAAMVAPSVSAPTVIEPLRTTLDNPPPMRPPRPAPERAADVLLAGAPSRKRPRSPLFTVLAVLLGLVVLAGVYVVGNLPAAPTTPTPTLIPTRTLSFISYQQTLDAQNLKLTVRPVGTLITIVPILNVLPTWTPAATATPPATFTPTATPVPIAQYTLMFAGEGRGRANIGIYLINGDGKNERLLIPGDARAFDAAWSPDGKQIAFVTDVNGKEQIAIAAADGTGAHPITTFKGTRTRSPAWSPDGKQLVVVSNESGVQDLYMLAPDGSALRKLTDSKANNKDASWSPDGKQLVYASDPTGQNVYQVYSLALDSGQSTQLTQSQNSSYNPAWSPDGNRIAFISTRNGRANVYVMGADGSDQQSLTYGDSSGESRDPAWSLDSRLIVFSSNRDGVFNLYATAPDSTDITQITHQKSASVRPRIRP